MPSYRKVPLLYQNVADKIHYESLPPNWLIVSLHTFSKTISLFDYQQEAVKNAIKLLYYYYGILEKFHARKNELINFERKKRLFNKIKEFEKLLVDNLGISNKKNNILFNKLKQYYPVIREGSYEKISFMHFVNRMSFWMATGSGKTVILIKLIELLDSLKRSNLIPNNDILILTHKNTLINQIKQHIDDFNTMARKKIRVWDLNKYDTVKRWGIPSFKDDINIFIYRSDLISEETKEKLLSFEDVDNDGKWYVLLDEAHKGSKVDSKRQLYYSIMTRNGFLFNFSATFTDVWDIITTTYNFNLDTFIRKGYGKNVYLSQQEFNAFGNKVDFDDKNKQMIVLKSLIFLTLNKMAKNSIVKKIGGKYYHNPLLVALVNSVNVEDSDLEIFFKELEKIASGKVQEVFLEQAKEEIIEELSRHPRYVFGSEKVIIDKKNIRKIELKDLLEQIFNASSFGNIEVIKIPQNKEELIFKLRTSDKPFALIKIGDISTWLKNKLEKYEINDSYNNDSYFKTISHGSNFINILMGSRAFYEGWDSNRPNVMLFINIGKGDAKKYITQSIGRGVRIEPIRRKRKRLCPLGKDNNIIAREIYSQLEQEDISIIETLFILGTNKRNVREILESIKYEKKISGEVIELKKNDEVKDKKLFIPVYKDKEETVAVEEFLKFKGNKELLTAFMEWIEDERLIYALFSKESHVNPITIEKVKRFLRNGDFVAYEGGDACSQLTKLMKHVNVILKDLDKFKQLDDEIIHFKKIKVTLDEKELQKLKDLVKKVKKYKDLSKQESELKKALESKEIDIDGYSSRIKELTKMSSEEDFITSSSTLKIKYLANHYYVPVILSDKEKIDGITHIINIERDKRFIKQLERFIEQKNNVLESFDWWVFCKLDKNLDNVYIPYYDKTHNKIGKFQPSFIFWLKKGVKYFIIFVDPKGTSHTDFKYKVDGYKLIFEEKNHKKEFLKSKVNIYVHLFLFTNDMSKLSKGYRKYWFNDFGELMERFVNEGSSR